MENFADLIMQLHVADLWSSIIALAAALGTLMLGAAAIVGLAGWRVEHKKKAQWDVARRALITAEKVREGIRFARAIYVSPAEENTYLEEALAAGRIDEGQQLNTFQRDLMIQQGRYARHVLPHAQAFKEMEHEVFYTCRTNIENECTGLVRLANKYINSADQLARVCNTPALAEQKQRLQPLIENLERTVQWNESEDDEYKMEVDQIVASLRLKIEGFLDL